MNQGLIAIFDPSLKTVAFISDKLELEITGYLTSETESKLKSLVEIFKTKLPELRTESLGKHTVLVGFEQISANDSSFLAAVSEELKMAGFIAKLVPASIKSVLDYMAFNLTEEERKKIIGELVNLPHDIEPDAIDEFQEILSDLVNQTKTAPAADEG